MTYYPKFIADCAKPISLKNLKFDDPKIMEGAVPWVICPTNFTDNGVRKELCFRSPQQHVWGISPKMNEQTGMLKEYNVKLPLESRETVGNPTGEERTFREYLDYCYNAAYAKIVEVSKWDKETIKSKLSKPTFIQKSVFASTIRESIDNDSPADALKPWKMAGVSPSEDTKSKDVPLNKKKWVVDPSKSEKASFKIWAKRNAETVITNFWFPQEKEPHKRLADVIEKAGSARLLIAFDGIYIGQHGDQTWVAHLNFRVLQMNFTPMSARVAERLLEPNNDAVIVDEEDEPETVSREKAPIETPQAWNGMESEESEEQPAFKPVTKPSKSATPPRARTPEPEESTVKAKPRKHKHRRDRKEEDSS